MQHTKTLQTAGQGEDNNEKLARRILGDTHFNDLLNFFLNLFKESVDRMKQGRSFFVAFFTRRCHVLMQIFLNIVLSYEKKPRSKRPGAMSELDLELLKKTVRARFVTDANLLTMVESMAENSRAGKPLPEFLVIDELLLHGRTLNSFLLKFESRLGGNEELRADFQRALEIFVYAQKDTTTLVLPRYRECVNRDSCRYLSGKDCGDLSLRLSQMVSVSAVNNVGFSWSLRIPIERDKFFAGKPLGGGTAFRRVRTTLQNIEQDSFIWLYPSPDNIKAICTVRAKTSAFTLSRSRRQMYVPYIIFDRLPLDSAWQLHCQMLEDFQSEGQHEIARLLTRNEAYHTRVAQEKDTYYRWICETNSLILGYMLMRHFLDEVLGFEQSDYLECKDHRDVDFDQVARNYAWAERDEASGALGDLEDMQPILQAIWDWEPPADRLKTYLNLLLADATPVWASGGFGEESKQDYPYLPIVNRVQDAVAEISYKAERNAMAKIASGMILDDKSLADWSASYSIRELLERCKEKFDEQMKVLPPDYHYNATIYHVLGIVIQCMDLGLLSMTNGFEEGQDGEGTAWAFTTAKAGEQAQNILPARYRNLLPVLEMIVANSGENKRDVETELHYFILDVEKKLRKDKREFYTEWLEQSLKKFLDELDQCGQSLESWDFLCENEIEAPEPDWHSTEQEVVGAKIESITEQLEYLNIWRGNEP